MASSRPLTHDFNKRLAVASTLDNPLLRGTGCRVLGSIEGPYNTPFSKSRSLFVQIAAYYFAFLMHCSHGAFYRVFKRTMTTIFTCLPIIDHAPLACLSPSNDAFNSLATQLHDVFETTGFAYLINAPLTFSHDEVLGLAKDFFSLPEEHKMSVARKTFQHQHENTYRGS
jgi:non-haem dioxygenase in morphine synthesis N-terminal